MWEKGSRGRWRACLAPRIADVIALAPRLYHRRGPHQCVLLACSASRKVSLDAHRLVFRGEGVQIARNKFGVDIVLHPLCDPFTLVEQMHILSLQAKIAISDTFQISTSIVLDPPLSENGKEAFRDLRGTLSSLTGINKRTLLSAHVVLG